MEYVIETKRLETTQDRRESNFILLLFINYEVMERHGSIKWKRNASSKETEWKQYKNFVKF